MYEFAIAYNKNKLSALHILCVLLKNYFIFENPQVTTKKEFYIKYKTIL